MHAGLRHRPKILGVETMRFELDVLINEIILRENEDARRNELSKSIVEGPSPDKAGR